MKILLTSDWQTDFGNQDLCEQSLTELLAAAEKYRPDAIVHCGDFKDAYNPVDIRVAKFWVWAVRKIVGAGHRLIALLGNHDRISQSSESKNWLDILKVAGAETVTEPAIKTVGDGHLFCLPFTADRKQACEWAERLSEKKSNSCRVLVFHLELQNAVFNAAGISTSGMTSVELRADRYDACFGGHIHHFQKVAENVWYVGSPFCLDWNEVNSVKGHLLAEVRQTTREGKKIDPGGSQTPRNGFYRVVLRRLITKIPHWYDAEYLETQNVTPEPGAYIRSKVAVASKKITDQLADEQTRLKAKYGVGMRYYVVPSLGAADQDDVKLTAAQDDRQNVARYVASTIPLEARFRAEQAIAYMDYRLGQTGVVRKGSEVRFKFAVARNVLSFRKCVIPYDKQGLVLLRGRNVDWPKRSNGAGKTNALSLLPVALFGQTLKGQKHDRWARERCSKPARLRLVIEDVRKREVSVIRKRRPHGLHLIVDGADKSSGIRGTGRDETQGFIERITGFDMQLLLNSVYIDQTIANGFVFGTQKDRMDLMGKLQNLERFDKAQKRVGADIAAAENEQRETLARLEMFNELAERLESELAEREKRIETVWEEKLAAARQELVRLTGVHAELSGAKEKYNVVRQQLDDLENDLLSLQQEYSHTVAMRNLALTEQEKHRRLERDKKCYVCGQSTTRVIESLLSADSALINELTRKKQALNQSMDRLREKIKKGTDAFKQYDVRMLEVDGDLRIARERIRQAEEGQQQENERNLFIAEEKKSLILALRVVKRQREACQENRNSLAVYQEMLEYAKKAFSRYGMPMYLCAGMCPALNRAADEYSDIFNDGRLKVHFSVSGGEFNADVVNPAGSDSTEGQSVGESAMAGIIAAFALREVAPKTNLLILDEPGHGLDPENAKQFAQGLLRLKGRFETVIVTTHHPVIEAALSGETVWVVTKRNGISTLNTKTVGA